MQRGKNQGSDATVQQGDVSTMVQQGDASTIVNAPNTSVPDGSNLGTNAMQEYGVMVNGSRCIVAIGTGITNSSFRNIDNE